jgi:Glycosyl hydrolases family 16
MEMTHISVYGISATLTLFSYLPRANAVWSNLTYATSESAIMKVDTSYSDTIGGRNSVRIQSNNTYNDGLFIFDILHTPYGCGTWPALWLSDSSNWPTNGEIDIIEATNNGTWGNSMTLHTTNDCSMSVKRKETGSVTSTNCYNGTNGNEGCGVKGSDASYGPEFNKNGGGVSLSLLNIEVPLQY